jgi:hypothetical protein
MVEKVSEVFYPIFPSNTTPIYQVFNPMPPYRLAATDLQNPDLIGDMFYGLNRNEHLKKIRANTRPG